MPVDTPLEGDSLSDRVAKHIVSHIRENQLVTGQKLPSEIQVSTSLGISRGIVRETYSLLRASGVIEVANGRVPRVGRLNNGLLTQLMSHALLTRQVTPEDMLDLRGSIEVRAAELAAEKRRPVDLDALRNILAGMKSALRKPAQFVQLDVEFHEAIGRATGNPLFEFVGGALRECLETSVRAGIQSRVVHKQLSSLHDLHAGIVDAIEARAPKRARDMMSKHFVEARRALHGIFKP